jgi:hypothetical protein
MDVTAVISEMKRQAIRTEELDPVLSKVLWQGVLLIEDLTTPDATEEDEWPEN